MEQNQIQRTAPPFIELPVHLAIHDGAHTQTHTLALCRSLIWPAPPSPDAEFPSGRAKPEDGEAPRWRCRGGSWHCPSWGKFNIPADNDRCWRLSEGLRRADLDDIRPYTSSQSFLRRKDLTVIRDDKLRPWPSPRIAPWQQWHPPWQQRDGRSPRAGSRPICRPPKAPLCLGPRRQRALR